MIILLSYIYGSRNNEFLKIFFLGFYEKYFADYILSLILPFLKAAASLCRFTENFPFPFSVRCRFFGFFFLIKHS